MMLERVEVVQRRLSAKALGLVPALVTQCSPVELGGTSFPDVIARRLHISKGAARRRIADAAQLAPRCALTGEKLAPMLPNVAAALRVGEMGEEQVRIVRGFFDRLPVVVDAPTRMMALLNPDGEFSEAERARRRGVTIGSQGFDGMSPISGLLDPETRAYLDAVFSKLAAPGMCNPSDETPLVDGEPLTEAAERDTRTGTQRNHDALRATLACGELGSHHGLSVTVVVSTTLRRRILIAFDENGIRPLYLDGLARQAAETLEAADR